MEATTMVAAQDEYVALGEKLQAAQDAESRAARMAGTPEHHAAIEETDRIQKERNDAYDALMVMRPEVGAAATYTLATDRHACTVIAVSPSGHQVTLQEDKAIRTDDNGMSDAQTYRYERNENGRTVIATRRKDGRYRLAGWHSSWGGMVGFIGRRTYRDYGF